jgi:8-oxo-dGTP pyrophosphatase MutT (NUDIX family)
MVKPRYASTVVLVRRDERGSFEILLTRRPPQMKFLGGFYVFPGGAVHPSDYSPKVLQRCSGISGGDARKILGGRCDESIALGHWVAGIREVFFFHRVTPEVYPLRFDTCFYLSPLPPNQTPLLRSEEVTDSLWIKPAEALARIYRDNFPLLPPTTTVLDDLSQVASWERLCAQFSLR